MPGKRKLTSQELAQKFIAEHGDEIPGMKTELDSVDYVVTTLRPPFYLPAEEHLSLADMISDPVGQLPAGLLGEAIDNFRRWRGDTYGQAAYDKFVLGVPASALGVSHSPLVSGFVLCARWTHAKMQLARAIAAVRMRKKQMARFEMWLLYPNRYVASANVPCSRSSMDRTMFIVMDQMRKVADELDIPDRDRLLEWFFTPALFTSNVAGHKSTAPVRRPHARGEGRRDVLEEIKSVWPGFHM